MNDDALSPDELAAIANAEELEIATQRTDGTLRRWTPIWVVRVRDNAYVRTWYRRERGWFGQVLNLPKARIRVPGVEIDVSVHDLGSGNPELRSAVDRAYRSKYGRYGEATTGRMTSDEAAASTLRLVPRR